MQALMGIDLGTSSVRAMVYSIEEGVLSVKGRAYDVAIPQAGWAEQDPDMWYTNLVQTIQAALEESGVASSAIQGISFSGQMHGLVCVDKNGTPLRPAILWPDLRSAKEIEAIYSDLGTDFIREQTQNNISTGFLLASLVWMQKNEPETFAKIDKVMLPKDYVKYKLTGHIVTDYSDAAGSLAFDNNKLGWSKPLLNKLGLPIEIFPPCESSLFTVGFVSGEASAETGLSTDTKVINGGSDQCMQGIGSGVITDGIFSSNIGTGGQISTSITTPVFDEQMRVSTFAHVMPGKLNVMGACLSSGASLKWLGQQVINTADYAALDAEAAKLPAGSEKLLFLPYLSGERTPHFDPHARGVFFGLNLKHNQYHMARAVMEGVAFSLRNCMDVITGDMGIACQTMIASGGGANSDLWMQIQSDIFERDIYRSKTKEQACIGAVATAAVACGIFKDYNQAVEKLVEMDDKPFTPIAENVAVYNELYDIFLDLYTANKELFNRLYSV